MTLRRPTRVQLRLAGIEYLDVRPGYCRLALVLQPHMLNFQGSPHGGVIFTLADVAFGTACNAHGAPHVAISVTMNYLSAASPGSRLVAEARELSHEGPGFYEVSITEVDGRVVAAAHCISQPVGRRSGAAGA